MVWDRVRVWSTLRVQRWIATEIITQITSQIDQIGTRVNPILQIRDRDRTRWINERMLALDHHIASRIHENERRMARVGLHEPDDDGYVVSYILEHHRDCAVGLEKVDGAAVVVGKRGGLGLERGVGFG